MKIVSSFFLITWLFATNLVKADESEYFFNATDATISPICETKLALGKFLINAQRVALIELINAIEKIQQLQKTVFNNESIGESSLERIDNLNDEIKNLASSLKISADSYPNDLSGFLLINEIRKMSSIVDMQVDLLHQSSRCFF